MKQKWMWLKELWQDSPRTSRVIFWVLLTLGVAFLIISFIMPPQGQIDKSVLEAFAMVQGFASIGVAFANISIGKSVKIAHGQTTIEVGDDDD